MDSMFTEWIKCIRCMLCCPKVRLQSVLDNKTAPCTLFVEVASQRAAELSTDLQRRLWHRDVVCEMLVGFGK